MAFTHWTGKVVSYKLSVPEIGDGRFVVRCLMALWRAHSLKGRDKDDLKPYCRMVEMRKRLTDHNIRYLRKRLIPHCGEIAKLLTKQERGAT